ncbi:MAG: hypothetical protein ACXVGB_00620 [Mycobacteriaceae bacterium]
MQRKTCSQACRHKRSRRIAKARKQGGQNRAHPPELQPLYQADQGKIEDAAMEVMRDELKPVVREALTDDVLRAIQDLVHLTPLVVEKITEDLKQDDDKVLRQRAYTLLAKYTLGNPSVAPPPPEQAAQGMQVTFVMPRPGDSTPALTEPQSDGDAVEVRNCMECKQDKPDTEFVGNSDRCTQCHQTLQARVRERFGGGED